MIYLPHDSAAASVIIGEDEIKNGTVTIKNMLDGKQDSINSDELADF
ncbi:MAG: His/Gly/Thr/Pro-type tRNA ligase C-terminal domain-containing protein [Bacteroidales bacterium]|nr:His/Gly/Thr/Pro-type tRNA ligase C-terminal domain-containing protein [Bacteroidales bacterium]